MLLKLKQYHPLSSHPQGPNDHAAAMLRAEKTLVTRTDPYKVFCYSESKVCF